MKKETAQAAANELFELFELHGSDDYIGENISQIEHAAQAAQMAEAEGYDDEVILAALLHDIGHICGSKMDADKMGGYGVQEHEKLGADYLQKIGFSEKIWTLVQNHVTAKRYLTYKYPEYYEKLSDASKQTLKYQGGPMEESEAIDFEKHPLFEVSLKMREWDERAKEENVPLPDFEQYKNMAIHHLNSQQLD